MRHVTIRSKSPMQSTTTQLRAFWLRLISAAAIAVLFTAGIRVVSGTPARATGLLLVTAKSADSASTSLSVLDATTQLAFTLSVLVPSLAVRDPGVRTTARGMSDTELVSAIAVHAPVGTPFVEVTVLARDRETAAEVADALVHAVTGWEPIRSAYPGMDIVVVETALASAAIPASSLTMDLAIATNISIVAMAATSAGMRLLRPKAVRSRKEITEITGLPALGRVADVGTLTGFESSLFVRLRPESDAAEDFRRIRSSLLFGANDNLFGKAILIASAGPREGRSIVAANLAIVLGFAGYRVCLIDADLRAPVAHRMFGLSDAEGLSSVLGEGSESRPLAQQTIVPNVSLVPAGPEVELPSEALASPRLALVLDSLRSDHDVLIIDSPPLNLFTDAAQVAAFTDGVILVTSSGLSNADELRTAVFSLQRVGAHLMGVVLNRC